MNSKPHHYLIKSTAKHFTIAVFFLIYFGFIIPLEAIAAPLAFPEAEGFGANAKGGRGGRVIKVTNLNDSGAGSLRQCAAVETGPRICVFTIGGTITLNSDIDIVNPFLTITGQTAPGGGITLKAANSASTVHMQIRAPEVIVRYMRFRPGTNLFNSRALSVNNPQNIVHDVMIDHNSFSWTGDEMTILWLATNNVSYQWNIIAESFPPIDEETAGDTGIKGPSFGEDGGGFYSVHHNLIAHHTQRLPQVSASGGPVDLVNNVIYNPGGQGSVVKNGTHANYVKNYIKTGPNSRLNAYIHDGGAKGPAAGYYVEGNVIVGNIQLNSAVNQVNTRFTAPALTETTAQIAYNDLLQKSGAYQGLDCSGNWVSRRDSVDTRIIQSVQDGTRGHSIAPANTFQGLGYISRPSDVGGWPTLAAGTACPDSDNDGMPDQWENTKFGNLTRTSSGTDLDPSYTNIEMYINGSGTVLQPTPTRTPTPPGGCTTSSQCLATDWCQNNQCVPVVCATPPDGCTISEVLNHQCIDGSRAPGTPCTTPNGNPGSCQLPPAGGGHTQCIAITPTPGPGVPGDVNGDGGVNIADLSTLLSNFGINGTRNQGDLDGNGIINLSDLSILLSNFGRSS